MEFFVSNIEDYTYKCQILELKFINTNTLLDDCKISAYCPKSINIISNKFQNIPHFVCNSAFGYYKQKTIYLLRQINKKLPRGKKLKHDDIIELLTQVESKFNLPDPPKIYKQIGNFIGIEHAEFITKLKYVKLISKENVTFHSECTKYLHELTDKNNNIIICKTYSDNLSNTLTNFIDFTYCKFYIDKHYARNGQHKNYISNLKVL